jgi:hypothetical protein
MLDVDEAGVYYERVGASPLVFDGGPLGGLEDFANGARNHDFVRERFGQEILASAVAEARRLLARVP